MNSFSLRPRLLILVHKGRQLLLALQQQSCAKPLSYRAHAPVQLPVQKQTVRSQKPLTLPRQLGVCARVSIALEHWQIEAGDAYVLPDLALQFTPPGAVESIELCLSAGCFKTFAQGNPFKQILEYWATLLHCDLSPLGWRVYRQGTFLCIEAGPERAGWNLKGSFVPALLESLRAKAPKALPLPRSFDSQTQKAGQSVMLTWGPYRLGGVRYACRLTYDPTWRVEELQHAFQEALQMQGFSYEIQWPEGYLQLGFPAHLALKKETAFTPADTEHPFLVLDLNPVQQRQHAVAFMCNGQRCQFEARFDTREEMLAALREQLAPTTLQITLDDDGHLCFQARDTQTPLVIAELTESARSSLGLSEVNESAPNLAYNDRVREWQDWLTLAHQYVPLLQAEADLQKVVSPFLNAFGEKNVNDLYLEAWQRAFQEVLDALDAWMLASEVHTSSPLWGVNLVNPSSSPGQGGVPQRPELRPEKNVATSNFDHKI